VVYIGLGAGGARLAGRGRPALHYGVIRFALKA
jgi:hypothetical protein